MARHANRLNRHYSNRADSVCCKMHLGSFRRLFVPIRAQNQRDFKRVATNGIWDGIFCACIACGGKGLDAWQCPCVESEPIKLSLRSLRLGVFALKSVARNLHRSSFHHRGGGSGRCGSGFSREEGGFHSRLKPLTQVVFLVAFRGHGPILRENVSAPAATVTAPAHR